MKVKIITTTLLFISVSWGIQSTFNETSSKPDGSPAGYSGSPGDGGKTCASSGCHTGNTVKTKSGMITSNIPASGYVPNAIYTITAKATSPNVNRWGFEVSPQNAVTGALMGQMIVTNTTQTKLVGSGKYITHKTAGNSGAGTKKWQFNWKAPAAGSGKVKFYGTFIFANNNGSEKGDTCYKSTMVKNEDTIPLINDPNKNGQPYSEALCPADLNLIVFPNPFTATSQIKLNTLNEQPYSYQLITLNGKEIKKQDNLDPGISHLFGGELSPGIYLLRVKQGDQYSTVKIIKTKNL